MSYAYFAGRGRRARDLGRAHIRKLIREKAEMKKPIGTITTIELTGEETEDQCKDIAFQMFANAHPIEAHQNNPEKFWEYFHERAPNISREEMVVMLKKYEEENDND